MSGQCGVPAPFGGSGEQQPPFLNTPSYPERGARSSLGVVALA
jgi:hypothetical protein